MEQVNLRAERRQGAGTRPSRRLRAEGDIPAVLYGRGLDSTPLTVSKRDLYSVLHTDAGTNALINLEVGSDKFLTVARELQRHPVRGEIIHLDFINISLTEKIHAEVGIEFLGEPAGTKDGGIVDTIRNSVMISALPMEIPAHIQLDISALEVGETLTVASLPVIEGVEYLEDDESPLVSVVIPRILEVEPVAEVLGEDGEPLVSTDEESDDGDASGDSEDEG
jgi:large subunit ribosomal protein L25